jgi:hypothetical protein
VALAGAASAWAIRLRTCASTTQPMARPGVANTSVATVPVVPADVPKTAPPIRWASRPIPTYPPPHRAEPTAA